MCGTQRLLRRYLSSILALERATQRGGTVMDTNTLIIIIVVVLLIGGGGFYGRGRWY
jgi:hypothetical protein